MTKQELYKTMRDIVEDTCTHYQSDLDFDIKMIEDWDARPRKAAWLVREMGTQFMSLINTVEPFEYIDAVFNNMHVEKSYLITYDGHGNYSIETATRNDFTKAYNKCKHYSLAFYRPYGEPTIKTGAFLTEDDAKAAAEYIKNKAGYVATSVVWIKA